MRELKIFGIVAAITLVVYIGIEPFAHSKLQPSVKPADFTFSDLGNNSNKIGDTKIGEELFGMSCAACHGLKSQDAPNFVDDITLSQMYGVPAPDLSNSGAIYDKNFLAELIKNPVHALKLEHKFNDEKPFPMTPYFAMLGDDVDQEVADIIAYLVSIAPKEMSGKEVYIAACVRCHDMKYDKLYSSGEKNELVKYMGMLPPDLSNMIRAKGRSYLETFLNDPQKWIAGTAMPRVGLTQNAQENVVGYMEKIGDSKKDERERTGYWMIGFFAILSVLAYLWKQYIWRDLH